MTSGSKIGSGTRRERHDPEVVAKTIAAKEKLAIAGEDVKIITPEEAARIDEREAWKDMVEAGEQSARAQQKHVEAVLRWTKALDALEEMERG